MALQTERVSKLAHKWVRFTAAFAFWLHAFLVFAVPFPPLEKVAGRVGMNLSEMLLGLFFITMTMPNWYSFWKFILDLGYIYVFPFIFIYKLGALCLKVGRHLSRQALKLFPKDELSYGWVDFAKQWFADESAWALLNKPAATQVINTVAAEAKAEESQAGKAWKKLSLPLRSFTLAWCLVIVSTGRHWLVIVGLIVICFHLLLFVFRLASGIISVKRMLSDAEKKLTAYVVGLLNFIMAAADESLANQEVANAVNLLALFRGAAFLLIHRAEVRYLFVVATFVVYAGIYVRVSMLFGFIYLGIAKLHNVPLSFADSMVNSFVMPVSYTNLPHDWVIQLAEDVHTLIAVLLGLETIFSYVQSKLAGLRLAASGIWEMLDPAEVRARMAVAAKKAAALRPKPMIAAQSDPPTQS